MTIKVVVGIITNSNNQMLITKRPFNVDQGGGLWEFPGGKLEQHETIQEALHRELKEEIGIDVITAQPWLTTSHDYGDRWVVLDIWRITEFAGKPHGKEGQEVFWVSKNALSQFEFPEGNYEILRSLNEKNDEFR